MSEDAENPSDVLTKALREGWARPPQSTFFHWFDAAQSSNGEPVPRRSVCGMARYRGATVGEIRRWEADPGICELCRDIRRARERGNPLPGQPTRTIALVPTGLPERIRVIFALASENGAAGPPFHQTLALMRHEGVTQQFLAAFLRYEDAREGKKRKATLRWNDVTLDEVRETDAVTRVRIVRELLVPVAQANPSVE